MRLVDVDAIVMGAGAMGTATAWHLARRARQVVVLEQFEEGHDRGSSHGTSRVFRLAYRDARYVALAARALQGWRELEADAGAVLLEQTGQLDHGDAAAIAEIGANLRAAGRPFERLAPAAAAERWSGMRFDDAVLLSPEGGRCLADATVAALTRRAADHGGELHFSTPVERISVDDDPLRPDAARATVHTPSGSWRAPALVVAGGAWLQQLSAHVSGRLAGRQLTDVGLGLPPLRVTLEQPAHFTPRDPSTAWISFLHHVAGRRPGHPLGFGAYGVFSGGEGMKVGEHGTGPVVDPGRPRPAFDAAAAERLGRYVADWFPGLDPQPASISTCLYTTTADEHFLVDRRGPLVICSPCSGHGFKFVPAIGAMAADLALGGVQDEPAWRLPG